MDANRGTRMVEDRPAVDNPPTVEDRPAALPDVQTGNIGGGEGDIRCPLCAWTPAPEDRWMCRCTHSWNTFDTGGVCPNCLYQWEYTQCLACHGWSLHSAWYPKT